MTRSSAPDRISTIVAHSRLEDGRAICIRAVTPDDEERLRDGIDQLTSRASTPEVAQAMIAQMAWYDAYLDKGRVDRSANTTPGNKKGGLSNIVEKAMGSIVKSGSAPITVGRSGAAWRAGPDRRRDRRRAIARMA